MNQLTDGLSYTDARVVGADFLGAAVFSKISFAYCFKYHFSVISKFVWGNGTDDIFTKLGFY